MKTKNYFLNAKNLLIKKLSIITTMLIKDFIKRSEKSNNANNIAQLKNSNTIVNARPSMNFANSIMLSKKVTALELKTSFLFVKKANKTAKIIDEMFAMFSLIENSEVKI